MYSITEKKALIERQMSGWTEANFCTGMMAQNYRSEWVPFDDPNATKFCAMGRLIHGLPIMNRDMVDEIDEDLQTKYNNCITYYNDRHDQDVVKNLLLHLYD